ncbi:reverse transcriptase family protein [Aeromonas media]|uniref:reverse transcriptase family protein n=1 Tax=Aeromonas media TaxID=651 RepID=UPI0038CFD9C2
MHERIALYAAPDLNASSIGPCSLGRLLTRAFSPAHPPPSPKETEACGNWHWFEERWQKLLVFGVGIISFYPLENGATMSILKNVIKLSVPTAPNQPTLKTTKKISSLVNLCAALGIDESELEAARSMPSSQRYVEKKVPKSSGGERTVFIPHPLIKKIQRRINNRVFSKIVVWPYYLFGSVPSDIEVSHHDEILKRDYISCAGQHCKSKSILKYDIENFFDNIHYDLVYELFTEFFKYSDDVAKVLSDLCCINGVNGHVVQGAPTSSYLASLCLWDVEYKVVKRLERKNLVYTRLVDDITVSSKIHGYNFENAQKAIEEMILNKDLPINKSKSKSFGISSEPLSVHGLRVNFNTPRLPSDEVGRIRASVKNIELRASTNNFRTSKAYRKAFERSLGRVHKLARVGHEAHKKLRDRLLKIQPLPSKRDVQRVKRSVELLELKSKGCVDQIKYSRSYHIAMYYLNIVNRTDKYKPLVEELRARLHLISPEKEMLGDFFDEV